MKHFHFFWDLLPTREELGMRLADGLFERRALWIFDGIFNKGLKVVWAINIGTKFPDIASHIVEAKIVGGESFDCC